MRYRTAEDLLRQIHYKPEYELTWHQPWSRDGRNLIEVQIEAVLPNSSDYPRYERKSIAGGRFQIDLSEIAEGDSVTFLRIVLNNLINWETHEAREFFRFGPGWIAPFHPHKTSGNELWADTNGTQKAEVFAAA